MNTKIKKGFFEVLIGMGLLGIGLMFTWFFSTAMDGIVIVVFKGLIVVGGFYIFKGLFDVIENNKTLNDTTSFNYNSSEEEKATLEQSSCITLQECTDILIAYITKNNVEMNTANVDWKSAAKNMLDLDLEDQKNLTWMLLSVVYEDGTRDDRRMGAFNQIVNYINISPYLIKELINKLENSVIQ